MGFITAFTLRKQIVNRTQPPFRAQVIKNNPKPLD